MLRRSFVQFSSGKRRPSPHASRSGSFVLLTTTVSAAASALFLFSTTISPAASTAASTSSSSPSSTTASSSRLAVTGGGGGAVTEKKRVSVHAVRGPRAAMEDRWFVSDDLRFFAVYDGHGGYRVAEQAQKLLYDEFCKELKESMEEDEEELSIKPEEEETEAMARQRLAQFAEDPAEVEFALVKSFDTVSKKILSSTYLDLEGSTAVVLYLCNDNIVSANVGDSRAILCRGSRAVALTTDHKPDSVSEKKRIEDLGGKVKWHGYLGPDRLPVPGMGAYRINGNLAVSRALGDRLERPYVSSEPDIVVVPRNKDEDRFVVLASDGLWDVMTSQDVVDFVRQIMAGSSASSSSSSASSASSSASSSQARNKLVVPFVSSASSSSSQKLAKTDVIRNEMDKRQENMAQFIVEEALRRGSADNVTVIVAWLR